METVLKAIADWIKEHPDGRHYVKPFRVVR